MDPFERADEALRDRYREYQYAHGITQALFAVWHDLALLRIRRQVGQRAIATAYEHYQRALAHEQAANESYQTAWDTMRGSVCGVFH